MEGCSAVSAAFFAERLERHVGQSHRGCGPFVVYGVFCAVRRLLPGALISK
jgi:hypothetical protein